MAADHDSSLAELKNNSERSRADLAVTVSKLRIKATDTAAELKERVSVPHIKKEIAGHLRESKDNLVLSLTEKARRNPLQAVAIGAGLAYPLWGLIRSIPLPLVLVGGGFWLAHKSKQGTVESDLTARAAEQAKVVAAEASDMASHLRTKAAERAERVTRTVSDLADVTTAKANAAIGATTAKVSAVMGDVANYAAEARNAVAGVGQKAIETAAEVSDDARGTISNTAAQGVAAGRRSGNALLDFVQRNPLLVAGSGLVVGAFVAAAIPRTETENRMLGQGTDFVKDKMREAAATGVERATQLASTMAGEVIASAAQQGLSGESLTKAVEHFTDSIKSVAQKGVQTAIGEDKTENRNSALPKTR